MYLAVHTRPDIAFTCSLLLRFLNNPSQAYLKAAKRVFQYLQGTICLGIVYRGDLNNKGTRLYRYCDSDYGADLYIRRSVSSYIFFFARGVVLSSLKRQPIVSLLSTEAEYYTYIACIREALWLRQVLREMSYSGLDIDYVAVLSDNQGSLSLGDNPKLHQRTKHTDIKYYFCREYIRKEEIKLQFVGTYDIAADSLTKLLSAVLYKRFIDLLNI